MGVGLWLLCWSSGLGELVQHHLMGLEQLLKSDCFRSGPIAGSLPFLCLILWCYQPALQC